MSHAFPRHTKAILPVAAHAQGPADRLFARAIIGIDRVCLVTGGAESLEAALKRARQIDELLDKHDTAFEKVFA